MIGDFFFNTNEFPIGALMEKTITLRGGQLFAQKVCYRCCPVLRKTRHVTKTRQYHPYLLNITVEGDYDPSFVFTHKGKLSCQRYRFMALILSLEKFENLPSLYKMQNEHTMPGGLKAVAVTPYGRELEGSS